jgi:hypothetical protein
MTHQTDLLPKPKRKLSGPQFLTVGNAINSTFSREGHLTKSEKEIAVDLTKQLGFAVSSANVAYVRKSLGLRPFYGSKKNGHSKKETPADVNDRILRELRSMHTTLQAILQIIGRSAR